MELKVFMGDRVKICLQKDWLKAIANAEKFKQNFTRIFMKLLILKSSIPIHCLFILGLVNWDIISS